MATTYYVDPLAVGGDTGADWTNAWPTIQTAYDTAVAGDTVYCRGVETLTAKINVDTNKGDTTDGVIKFIGCNASGVVDGTRYIIDANSATENCIEAGGVGGIASYYWHENFEYKSATGFCVDWNNVDSDRCIWINCIAHNGNTGFYINDQTEHFFIRCGAYNNTNSGWYDVYYGKLIFCYAYGNGDGATNDSGGDRNMIIGCVFHDNGDNDSNVTQGSHISVINNIFDGTDQTGETGYKRYNGVNNLLLGNRLINLATGLDCNSVMTESQYNLFFNNTTDIANTSLHYPVPYNDDADTNEYDPDSDDGLVDIANNNFNIKSNRTLRRQAIDLRFGS